MSRSSPVKFVAAFDDILCKIVLDKRAWVIPLNLQAALQVQGGGGAYPTRPSPATARTAASLLGRRAGLPAEAQARAAARSVASVLQGFLALPACRLWDHPPDLQEAALTKEQVASVGWGGEGRERWDGGMRGAAAGLREAAQR
jgi:hypothetical protein